LRLDREESADAREHLHLIFAFFHARCFEVESFSHGDQLERGREEVEQRAHWTISLSIRPALNFPRGLTGAITQHR
jgi:hypothetical protein